MSGERLTGYIDELRGALRSRGAFDASVVDELRDHLIDAFDEGIRRGLSADAAEREAIVRCGSPDVVAAHIAAGTPRLRRRALLAICSLTALASSFLFVSLSILRPPGASYAAWIAQALFLAQAVLTIVVVRRGGSPSSPTRALLTAGAIALLLIGGTALYETALAVHHFEGYELVAGILLTAQGLMTVAYFYRRRIRLAARTLR
jgi:hypothetical protein